MMVVLIGFLSLIFDCYSSKTLPQKIFCDEDYIPNFLESPIRIETNFEKSNRVLKGIEKNIGYQTLYNTYYAFLSSDIGKEMDLLAYLWNGFKIGPKINHRLTLSYVANVMKMQKRVFGECHRLKGLLRFQEVGKNLYYSSIHPDNNILEPLGHHFMKRLPEEDFIIHDKISFVDFWQKFWHVK